MGLKAVLDFIFVHPSVEADVGAALCINEVTKHGFEWNEHCDVLVVGGGGAGITAAIEARDAGAQVMVLDRYNGGGSTKISGGIYYAGGGTRIQHSAGVDDTPENMYQYLRHEVQDAVSDATLRDFCNNSVGNLDWLCEQGVKFDASYCPFKTSYPPNQYYFYYSGNEFFPPYNETAKPAPRGHRAHEKGVSGAAVFKPLLNTAQRKGVVLRTNTRVRRLITDVQGQVIGVEAHTLQAGSLSGWCHRQLYALMIYLRYQAMYVPLINRMLLFLLNVLEKHCGTIEHIQARKGVVLAAGGYYYNKSMLQHYAPAYLPGMPLGTVGDDGAGIQLGASVGGQTGLMDSVSAWRFVNPPEAFIRGVMVDGKGQRICNEMLYGAQLAERMIKHHDGKGYLIIDQRMRREAMQQLGPDRSMWFQAATALMYLFLERKKTHSLEALAGKLGIDAQALKTTVDDYNKLAQSDENDSMGKPKDYFQPILEAPFYALNCSYDSRLAPCASLTLGGLKVNESTGEVLNQFDQSITGLYAAGRNAVGIASRSYVSGLSIADCVYSGRRAGRHAALRE